MSSRNYASLNITKGKLQESNKYILRKSDNSESLNVAYGTLKSNLLTESISSVEGSKLNSDPLHSFSFGNALQGFLPGLTVMKEPLDNWSELISSPMLYSRGLGTYNDNSLLVYVDGFESSMDYLVPTEVESVNLLKGPFSLAPFGMRGANGVLWITTKNGSTSKNRINLSLRSGMAAPTQLQNLLGSYDYANLYNEARSNDLGSWSPFYTTSDFNSFLDGTDSIGHPNINWYDQLLRTSVPYEQLSLDFKGGDKKMKYFVMLGYKHTPKIYKQNKDDSLGVLKDMGSYRQYNFRTNMDIRLSRTFKAYLRLGGSC